MRLPSLNHMGIGIDDGNELISLDLLAVFREQFTSLRSVAMKGLLELLRPQPTLAKPHQRLAQVPNDPQRSGPGIQRVYLKHVQLPYQIFMNLFDFPNLTKLRLSVDQLKDVEELLTGVTNLVDKDVLHLHMKDSAIVQHKRQAQADSATLTNQFFCSLDAFLRSFQGLQTIQVGVEILHRNETRKSLSGPYLPLNGAISNHRKSLLRLSLKTGDVYHSISQIAHECELLREMDITLGDDADSSRSIAIRAPFEGDAVRLHHRYHTQNFINYLSTPHNLFHLRHLQSVGVRLHPGIEYPLMVELNTSRLVRNGLLMGSLLETKLGVRFRRAHGELAGTITFVRI